MSMLLPELARGMAAFNRQAAGSAEAARLRREGAEAARKLTRLALSRGPDAQEVWQEVTEALREGVSGERARDIVGITLDVADTWLEMARNARGLWEEARAAGAIPEHLEELDTLEKEVREVRAAAEKMEPLLSRPRPPVDAARLQKGREEVEQGQFKTPEQMRAHFSGAGE